MALGLPQTVTVYKTAKAEKHRFVQLKVNEISLVTDPAIFTADEVEAGVGMVVIKQCDAETEPTPALSDGGRVDEDATQAPPIDGQVAEPTFKEVQRRCFLANDDGRAEILETLKGFASGRAFAAAAHAAAHAEGAAAVEKLAMEGEDIRDAVDQLFDASLLKLQNELDDSNVWWQMDPWFVGESDITLTDTWKMRQDPTSVVFYRMSFLRDAEGAYEMSEPTAFQLVFEETDVNVSKILSPTEKAMKTFKGFRIGETTLTCEAQPGGEYSLGDTVVVKIDDKGEVSVADGYALNDDGLVEKVAEVAPPEVDASQGLSLGLVELMAAMNASGRGFQVQVDKNGNTTLTSTDDIAAMVGGAGEGTETGATVETEKNLEALKNQLAEAEALVAKMHSAVHAHGQAAAGTEAAGDPAPENPTATTKNDKSSISLAGILFGDHQAAS